MFGKDIGVLDLNRLYQAAGEYQDSVLQALLMVETMIMWLSAVEV